MTTNYALNNVTPQIAEDAWIAPNAVLVGDVELGAGASVWFGVVARGDNDPIRIGAGSNVQDNAVLHADPGFPLTIGSNCTIGHAAIVHGCTIGDNSLVGMGAIVLNGAQVGRNCLIGAGALVTEGKVIPDGSLVIGSPARVARELTEAEIAGLGKSAEAYRRNAARFRAGLSPLSDDPSRI